MKCLLTFKDCHSGSTYKNNKGFIKIPIFKGTVHLDYERKTANRLDERKLEIRCRHKVKIIPQ